MTRLRHRFRTIVTTLALTAASIATRISAAALCLTALAGMTVATPLPGKAVVINRGVVLVENKSHVKWTIRLTHVFGEAMEVGNVEPGGTYTSDVCCFAAGSTYRIRISASELPVRDISFVPRLCNNGIPYGYAVVVIDAKELFQKGTDECYHTR